MSNYKVGDVASLFPTPSAANSGKNIQSLFNELNSNHKIQIAKGNFKKKFQKSKENSTVAVMSVPENKLNQKSVSSNTMPNKCKKKSITTIKNNSEVITSPSKKNIRKKRKLENIEDDFMMDSKILKEPTDIHSKAFSKTNKKMKKIKLDEMLVKSDEPVKKLSTNNSNRFNNHNKNHKDHEPNNMSEDLTDTKKAKSQEKEDLFRTLFVGNLPLSVNRKELHKLFCSFGHLKTVRVRGAIPCKSNIPKKVAEITNKYHESVQSHKGFVVFKDRESAIKALSLNGTLLDKHHIVVDFATNAGGKKIYDDKLSVFIGNLPFDVSDETVWSAFEQCGEIQAVRIIRDRNTGVGKGFGYILFQNTKSKERALALNELEISGRKIRIKSVENNPHKKGGSRETLKAIRKNVALKRSRENKGKKSVKKLLKKGRRLHQNKQIARILGKKFVE